MRTEHRILIIITLFYLLYILAFLAKFEFNPSSTIELSERYLKNFDGTLPQGLVVQVNSDGYDGQGYYMMAINPTLEKIHIIPNALQRIIYPLLASVLSFGIISLIPFNMLFINYVSIILSSYVLILILKRYKANLNLVFLWAFNVGLLICALRDLTGPLMILFVVAAIYLMEKQKYFISMIFLALAILTRDAALSVYVGLLLYFLIKLDFKKLRLYLLSIIPFLIWEVMLIFKTGRIPLFISFTSATKPFAGICEYLLNIPSYIYKYVIADFSLQNLLSLDYLRPIHKVFSPVPALIFALIQFIIMAIVFLKDKKITKYTLLLLSQLLMIFSLKECFFFNLEIGNIGRYAIPMFLFSIIYYIEKKDTYNRLLKVSSVALIALSLFMSIAYFINKIIIFRINYYIS